MKAENDMNNKIMEIRNEKSRLGRMSERLG